MTSAVTHSGSATGVVTAFLDALAGRDTERALALLAPDARIDVLPQTGHLSMDPGTAGRTYFAATVAAFPDLLLTVHRVVELAEGRVLVELSLEGTQAADYLGAINQEKHLDLRQAWLLTVRDGRIQEARGFWDENQLFRRLAVKRLDEIAIVGGVPA